MAIEIKLRANTRSLCASGALVGAVTMALLTAGGAHAIGTPDSIQPASLEVKQRIQAIEQINVTAEKPIDEAAPRASAEVDALLKELAALEAVDAPEG